MLPAHSVSGVTRASPTCSIKGTLEHGWKPSYFCPEELRLKAWNGSSTAQACRARSPGRLPCHGAAALPGPQGPGQQCWASALSLRKLLGGCPFLLPEPGALVKHHRRFPKPQHPEHVPEQAQASPNACPAQPSLQRRSVPRLYPASPKQDHRPQSQTNTVPCREEASWVLTGAEASLQGPEMVPRHTLLFPPHHTGRLGAKLLQPSHPWVGKCAVN